MRKQLNTTTNTTTIDRELLTFAEAAHILGVSRRTVSRLVESGKLNSITLFGRYRRIHRSEIDRLISNAMKEASVG